MSEQAQELKQQFQSNFQGWTHVKVFDHEGKVTTERVEPLGVCWLTPTEQQLTANMHARPEDNPFLEREHVHYDEKTLDEVKRFTAPTFQLVDGGQFAARPTGAQQAPEGRFAPGEITGTPA